MRCLPQGSVSSTLANESAKVLSSDFDSDSEAEDLRRASIMPTPAIVDSTPHTHATVGVRSRRQQECFRTLQDSSEDDDVLTPSPPRGWIVVNALQTPTGSSGTLREPLLSSSRSPGSLTKSPVPPKRIWVVTYPSMVQDEDIELRGIV